MTFPYAASELELFDRGLFGGLTLAADLGDRRVALLLANDRSEPPREFRVLAKGITATTKGPILFDNEAAKAVSAAFEDSGMGELPFDIGHGMLNPAAPPSGHAAAGWFTPEVRDGELWATSIAWTDDTAAALRSRQFRYFSPAIMRDAKTNRAVELINIALTNIPATKGQAPLMASQAVIAPAQMSWPTPAPTRKPTTMQNERHAIALGELQQAVRLSDADRLAATQLTAEDLKVCQLTGVSPADFLSERQREAAKGAA